MITQERLKELFHYCPETGVLARLRGTQRCGSGPCKSMHKAGYIMVRVDRTRYLAHRLAWLYVKGCWPKYEIDHINGDKADNRLINLRDVSRQENQRNKKKSRNNTSGITGVVWIKKTSVWLAKIKVDGRDKYQGSYKYKWDAICARKSAERKYGFHINHGRTGQ